MSDRAPSQTTLDRREVIKKALKVGSVAYVAPAVLASAQAVSAQVTPAPPVLGCDQQAAAATGGPGVTTNIHELGATSGPFQFYYDAVGVPDQFDIYYENQIIYTTVTPVSGSNTVQVNFGPGTSTRVTVVVTGPAGTVWSYEITCPNQT